MKEPKTKGKIDFNKIPKGHTPHRSGAGAHKNWRKKNRQSVKNEIKKEME